MVTGIESIARRVNEKVRSQGFRDQVSACGSFDRCGGCAYEWTPTTTATGSVALSTAPKRNAWERAVGHELVSD